MSIACLCCNREPMVIGMRRGAKVVCFTCMTINDPIELLKKIEDETEREVEEIARSLGMVGPERR